MVSSASGQRTTAVTAAGSGTVAALDVEHYLAARGDAGTPAQDAAEIDGLTDTA